MCTKWGSEDYSSSKLKSVWKLFMTTIKENTAVAASYLKKKIFF